MAVTPLRERLAKLQSKTKNVNPPRPKKEKPSFFNTDSPIAGATCLQELSSNTLPYLRFPDVDFTQPVTKSAILKVGQRLSFSHLFPQINTDPALTKMGNGTALLSESSKTSRISKQYPKIFIQDQLYALFKGQETQVDRLVNALIAEGSLRLIDMNLEHVGFGVLITQKEFTNTIERSFSNSNEEQSQQSNFKDLLFSDNSLTQIPSSLLLAHNLNIPLLISKGLICIAASEASPGIYNITLPHLGGLLRVVKNSVKWITDLTNKTKERMILDTQLRDKWFKPYVPPKSTKNSRLRDSSNPNPQREYYTTDRVGSVKQKVVAVGPGVNIVKFRGIGLDWVLAVLVGMGGIESFESPVGLVYKSTGKLL